MRRKIINQKRKTLNWLDSRHRDIERFVFTTEHLRYLAAIYTVLKRLDRGYLTRLRRVLFLTWQERIGRTSAGRDGVSVLRNAGAEFGWGLSVLGRGVAWCAPTDKHWSQLHVEAKRFPSWADHGLLTPGRLLERWQYNRRINTSSTFVPPLGTHSIFSSVIHQRDLSESTTRPQITPAPWRIISLTIRNWMMERIRWSTWVNYAARCLVKAILPLIYNQINLKTTGLENDAFPPRDCSIARKEKRKRE